MSFLVRAVLVIGVLSYFAATGDQPEGGASSIGARSMAALPALWDALPPEIRERAMREAAAQAGRQGAPSAILPASGDTLAESDRRMAWRGSNLR